MAEVLGAVAIRRQSSRGTPITSPNLPTTGARTRIVAENYRVRPSDDRFWRRSRRRVFRLKKLTVAQVDDLLTKKVRDEGYARITIQRWASVSVDFFDLRKDVAGAARGWQPRSWLRGSSRMKVCRSARPGMT